MDKEGTRKQPRLLQLFVHELLRQAAFAQYFHGVHRGTNGSVRRVGAADVERQG